MLRFVKSNQIRCPRRSVAQTAQPKMGRSCVPPKGTRWSLQEWSLLPSHPSLAAASSGEGRGQTRHLSPRNLCSSSSRSKRKPSSSVGSSTLVS